MEHSQRVKNFSDAISEIESLNQLTQTTVDKITEEFDLTTATIDLRENGNFVFHNAASNKYQKMLKRLIQKYRKVNFFDLKNQQNPILKRIKNNEIYRQDSIPDLFEGKLDPPTFERMQTILRAKEVATLPCFYHDKLLAFMFLVKDSKIDAKDEELLKIGEIVAQKIHELRATNKKVLSTLEAITKIVEFISTSQTEKKLAQKTVKMLCEMDSISASALYSVRKGRLEYYTKTDQKTKKFLATLISTHADALKNFKKEDANPLSHVYRSRQPLSIETMEELANPPIPKASCRYLDRIFYTKEILALPCIGHSEANSILIIVANSFLGDINKEVFKILAKEIGYALENRELLEIQRKEKEKFIKIVNNITGGVMVFEQDRLIHVSPQLSEITEYTAKEILSMDDPNELIVEEERKRIHQIANEREKGGYRYSEYRTKIRTKTGNIEPVEIRTAEFRFFGKELFTVSFRDISGEIESRSKLEKYYRKQAETFSEIAHSLKTPFTVINGLLELQRDNILDQEARNINQEIKKEVVLVNEKVSQLLDVARQDMTDHNIKFEKFDLQSFMEAFTVKAKALGYNYCKNDHDSNCECLRLEQNEKLFVYADKEALMDILTTIAENAYLHSPKKLELAHIRINSTKSDSNAKIVIKDQGKGIPKSITKKIFTPFKNTSPLNRGHGIGLPMCKKLVEKMHGSIRLKSTPGKGTEFIILIPLAN